MISNILYKKFKNIRNIKVNSNINVEIRDLKKLNRLFDINKSKLTKYKYIYDTHLELISKYYYGYLTYSEVLKEQISCYSELLDILNKMINTKKQIICKLNNINRINVLNVKKYEYDINNLKQKENTYWELINGYNFLIKDKSCCMRRICNLVKNKKKS